MRRNAEAVTIESGEGKKRSLRHRVLWWMHRYLAFDVALPEDTESSGTMPRAEEARATPPWPAVTTLPGRPPEITTAHRVLRASAAAITSFAVGDCIADVYDVVQIVNAGDLSTAHLSHHRQWDIDLIVKVPSPGLVTMPEMLREWVAGVERWAGLGVHPHIASCYSLQWFDGIPLAVTEHVGSDSMLALMSQGRCADLRVALNVAIDVCDGLEHAHRRGLIHGTLTPGNILLTPQGSPKLSDFELAIALGVPPQRGSPTSGTPPPTSAPQVALAARQLLVAPAYVAPERWGAAYMAQPAADVFALGACLYEMFFGRLPYASTAGAPQALPAAATLRNGDAPPEALLALLRRCVEWTPYRRPASVETVRDELCALSESLFGTPGGQHANPSQQAADWNTKAVSYHLMGNESDADEAWTSALAADPACLEAWFNRGIAAWRRGVVTDETVLEDLAAVAVSDAERCKAAQLLALIHHERGDLESALALLEQAHNERPDSVEISAALERHPRRLQPLAGSAADRRGAS